MKTKMGKRQTLYMFIMKIFRIFPVDNKKIVVSNFRGKGFGDNPKYIIEDLVTRNNRLKIYWGVENSEQKLPDYVRPLKINSIRYLYHLSTARIWIDNCRKPIFCNKRKKQYYIQTWHGALGFKKIEKEAMSISEEYKNASIHDSEMIDILLSGSKWCTDMLKRSFWYDGKIWEIGSPRNDIFFSYTESKLESIRKKIGVNANDYLILYAPTFRQNEKINVLDYQFKLWIKQFEYRTGKKCKVLLRLHPNEQRRKENSIKDADVIDVTTYQDMQELLLVCNTLITDYSSSAFEAALVYKPVFLLCSDYNEYIQKERDLFFDIHDLPFPFYESENDFINGILKFDHRSYIEKLDLFFTQIKSYEKGTASSKVANLIIKICLDGTEDIIND